MNEETLVSLLVSERLKLLGYIQSIVRRADVAEDVFQDVCVLAVQKRSGIQNEAHLLNWLRTAARLRSINVLRKRQERNVSLDDGVIDLLEDEWGKHDRDDGAWMIEAIRHCLSELKPAARDLVDKRYVEGLKYPEISKMLKRPITSLYVTFGRIHAALADCMSKQLTEGGGHV